MTKEKLIDDSRKLFLEHDQDKVIARLGLDHDEDSIFVDVLGQRLAVSRADGWVTFAATGERADVDRSVFVYDLLCHTDEPIALAGEWATEASLSGMQGGGIANNDYYKVEEKLFDARQADLARACQALGGTEAAKGDVAYLIPVCAWFPVYFQFFGSDEEFAPKMSVLFDANSMKYLYYDTLDRIISMLVKRLIELMG